MGPRIPSTKTRSTIASRITLFPSRGPACMMLQWDVLESRRWNGKQTDLNFLSNENAYTCDYRKVSGSRHSSDRHLQNRILDLDENSS